MLLNFKIRPMGEHGKDNPEEFMSNCEDSLSTRETVLNSFKEVGLKEGIETTNIHGHDV